MSGVLVMLSGNFHAGAVTGLQAFREQIVEDRGRIENELEPPVDVILELLDRCIAELEAAIPHPDQLELEPEP
jgi:hypothetical protein